MAFKSPDRALLRKWGEPATFKPAAGGTYEVSMVSDDNELNTLPGVLLVLFGTMDDSGFTDLDAPVPVKNDLIEFDGAEYRIFDTKRDRATGVAASSGMWLYLTEAE